ncbi:MAG: MFS transporter [Pseudomonadota bacterium]
MLFILRNSWPLFLGMMLLQVGNGLQGTLVGVRGAMEGFSAQQLSFVMSAYFVGFLGGATQTPKLIRGVGHVRVFAALASFISAALILYAAIPVLWVWFLLRVILGFCFAGVYVVAESWLNDAATNETRGQALSVYLIVQMAGIILAQYLLNVADPADYILFVVMSVLVSISFAPILLSVSPAPVFQTTRPMSIRELYHISPLGVVAMLLVGSVFSAMFTMASVYGTEQGLTIAQISGFAASFYVGGLLLQYPIGWISDRVERRRVIIVLTAFCAIATFVGTYTAGGYTGILVMGFLIGGITNPLYSLVIAYTNDFIEHEDMAAASGGLIFVNGLGAIFGPIILGPLMTQFGPNAYFLFMGGLLATISLYALYRSTQRAAPTVEEASAYAALTPTASPVAVEVAQEVAIEMAIEAEEEAAAEEAAEAELEPEPAPEPKKKRGRPSKKKEPNE